MVSLSSKSAYQVVREEVVEAETHDPIFEKVWQWQGPRRYQAHLWKIAHESLLTNSERFRHGMASNDLCPRCQMCPETVMHAIRDCEEVQSFWYDMIHPDQISHFFSIGLDGWLHLNLSSSEVGQTSTDWRIFFGIAVYELWCDRNRLVFVGSTALSQGLRFFTEK